MIRFAASIMLTLGILMILTFASVVAHPAMLFAGLTCIIFAAILVAINGKQ